MILDIVRTSLHRAITTPKGDAFVGVRVPKDLARRLNVTFGQPLCSADELRSRRAAEARLGDLRRARTAGKPVAAVERTAAPVMVYFEKDRNARDLARIEEFLGAKSVDYQLLDVAGDEATLTFVTRTAGCKDDDLPVVFVGGAPIGDYRALVEAEVSGSLKTALYG